MEKILSKINKTDYCWIWKGEIKSNGYGRCYFNGKNNSAHRLVYELLVGEIPKGLEIDHLCRNPKCVNPKHLEPVTHLENVRRSLPFRKLKTHCKQGHEFTPDNITRRNANNPERVCIKCKNENMRKLNLKKSLERKNK